MKKGENLSAQVFTESGNKGKMLVKMIKTKKTSTAKEHGSHGSMSIKGR